MKNELSKDSENQESLILNPIEQILDMNIRKSLSSKDTFFNKVQEIHKITGLFLYNLEVAKRGVHKKEIDIKETVSEEEKLAKMAIDNNMNGILHQFYPNELGLLEENHINFKNLVSRLIEMQKPTKRSKKTSKKYRK